MERFQVVLDLGDIFKSARFFIIVNVERLEVVLLEVHSTKKYLIKINHTKKYLNNVASPHAARICSNGNFGRATAGLPS